MTPPWQLALVPLRVHHFLQRPPPPPISDGRLRTTSQGWPTVRTAASSGSHHRFISLPFLLRWCGRPSSDIVARTHTHTHTHTHVPHHRRSSREATQDGWPSTAATTSSPTAPAKRQPRGQEAQRGPSRCGPCRCCRRGCGSALLCRSSRCCPESRGFGHAHTNGQPQRCVHSGQARREEPRRRRCHKLTRCDYITRIRKRRGYVQCLLYRPALPC
jgi:hypothetical protein